MAKSKRDAQLPLNRWRYFTKNLYNNTAKSSRFTYDKVVYEKSEALQDIEERSAKVNAVLLLALVLMFLLTTWLHSAWIVVIYLLLVIAGQIYRLCMLPKDIKAHLTDTGYRER